MTFSFTKEVWFAYVINNVMIKCKNICEERCQACKSKYKSPILHDHEQMSLLQKIECYLDEVRGNLLGNELENMFKKLSWYEKSIKPDKTELIDQIKNILLHATPQSLYYGRWYTVEHEVFLRDLFSKPTTIRKRKSKTQTSQKSKKIKDDILSYKTDTTSQMIMNEETKKNEISIEQLLMEALEDSDL